MTDTPEGDKRKVGSTGHFGARPTMMNPKTNPKPPTQGQGPKGTAGDSGAAQANK